MIKKIVLSVLLVGALSPAVLYAATQTATVINETNCSCNGPFANPGDCTWQSANKAVGIQPVDQNYNRYGPVIPLGKSGQAPIFEDQYGDSVINVFDASLDYNGVVIDPTPGASYYIVQGTMGVGNPILNESQQNPCDSAKRNN